MPRSALEQFAQIYASSFWFQHVALSCTEEHAKLLALLNFYIPLLLLFDEQADPEATPNDQAEPEPTLVRDLIGRILLAEQGKWDLLLDNFLLAHNKLVQIRAATEPAELTLKKKYQLFCKKVLGNCFKAATSILEQNNTPPDSPATFNSVKDLFTSELQLREAEAMQAAFDEAEKLAWNLEPKHRITIQPKHVIHRLHRLRNVAQPGLSRGRNSHLKVLIKHPLGILALTAWCQDWICGRIPMSVAAIWMRGHVKALGKPAGGVRPISLFEASYKLATGVLLDLRQSKLSKILRPWQFGCCMPAGAEMMTQILRTAAFYDLHVTHHRKLFFTSDVKNAFGEVPRSQVLKAVIKHAPELLPILLASWRPGSTSLFVPVGNGLASDFEVKDGLFQGECLATLLFCLVMHEAINTCKEKLLAAGLSPTSFSFLAYVDDVVLICNQIDAHHVWGAWVSTLHEFGLTVVIKKSASWCPTANSKNSDEAAPSFLTACTSPLTNGLDVLMPDRAVGGLPVLGTGVTTEFESCITLENLPSLPDAFRLGTSSIPEPCTDCIMLTPVLKRMQSVCDRCQHLQALLNMQLDCESYFACWIYLVKVLSVKLDFDFRVSSPALLLPYASKLQFLLSSVAASILGFTFLPDIVFEQISLPGRLSGMGVRNSFDTLMAGPVASYMQCRYPVMKWCMENLHFTQDEFLRTYPSGPAAQALDLLRSRSAHVGCYGQVDVEPPDHQLELDRPPLCAIAGMQGRICALLQQMRFLHLYSKAGNDRNRWRLLSSCGVGNGSSFESLVAGNHTRYSDVDFRIVTFHRVGLPIFPPASRCKHHSSKKNAEGQVGSWCNASLETQPDHAAKCNKGGGTIRMHKAIVQLVASFCREAGLETRVESVVPEFTREKPPSGSTRNSQREADRQTRAAENLAEHELMKHELAVLDVRAYHPFPDILQ